MTGLLILATIPVFFNPLSASQFEPDKAALLRWLVSGMIAGWAISRITGQSRARLAPMPVPVRWMCRVSLAWLLVQVLSAMLSLAPSTAWWGSMSRGLGTWTQVALICFASLLGSAATTPRQWDRLITAMILGSIPVSLFAIFQRAGWDPVSWGVAIPGRSWSTLGNPIFLGAYMAMMIPVTAGRLVSLESGSFQGKRSWSTPRMFHGAAMGLQTTACLAAFSRGSLIALLLGMTGWVVTILASNPRQSTDLRPGSWMAGLRQASRIFRKSLLAGSIGILLAIGLAGFSGILLPKPTSIELAQQLQSGTARVRTTIWDGVIQLMTESQPLGSPSGYQDHLASWRPWIGFGPECMGIAFSRVYPRELAVLETDRKAADQAHNMSLDSWVKTGWVGLGVYWAWVLTALVLGLAAVGMASFTPGRWWPAVAWLLSGGGLGGMIATLGGHQAAWAFVGVVPGMVIATLARIGYCWKKHAVRCPSGGLASQPVRAGLLAALMAHLLETQLAFPCVVTAMICWTIIALLAAFVWHDHAGQSAGAEPSGENVSAVLGMDASATIESVIWGTVTAAVLISVTLGLLLISLTRHAAAGVLPGLWFSVLVFGWMGLQGMLPATEVHNHPRHVSFYLGLALPLPLLHAALILLTRLWPISVRSVQDLPEMIIPDAGVILLHFAALLVILAFGGYFQRRILKSPIHWTGRNRCLAVIVVISTMTMGAIGSLPGLIGEVMTRQAQGFQDMGRYGLAARFYDMAADWSFFKDQNLLMAVIARQMKIQAANQPNGMDEPTFQEALTRADQAWAISPFRYEPPLVAGFLWLDKASCDGSTWAQHYAIHYFRAALALAPRHPQAYAGLARLYLLQGKPLDALEMVKRALAVTTGDARLFMAGAEARLRNGDPAGAWCWHREALSLDRTVFREQFTASLISQYAQAGILSQVETDLNRMKLLGPKDPNILWVYGLILQQRGDPKAATALSEAVMAGFGDPRAVRSAVLALSAAGRSAGAAGLTRRWMTRQRALSTKLPGE